MKNRGKLTVTAGLLVAVHFLALIAGFIAPYNYATQDREHPYARPARIHFTDCEGKFHLRPFVYATSPRDGTVNDYQEDCSRPEPITLFISGENYLLAGLVPTNIHLFGLRAEGRVYLLGTDGFGRDEFSRILYGAQISLFAGLLAAALALSLGMLVGTVAGAFGGWVDEGAMRLAEIFIAVPWFYLLLAVRSVLPLHVSPLSAFIMVIAVVGLLNWGQPARLVRGVVLSGRERNFIQAAEGFGAKRLYLLKRHLLPMSFSVALTQMAVLVPRFILAEVLLSFLGLGIGEPFPSWGNMMAAAQQYYVLSSYWWMILPALAPIPVFLAYHALADVLQEKLQSTI